MLRADHQEVRPGVVTITVSGRLMLGEPTELIEEIPREWMERGARKFIFDLSGVTHLDSTGIGCFIAAMNHVMAAGGKLRIAAASSIVRDSFRITRLDTVFPFDATVEAALAGIE
jgi:anti-sigma B factor antagonist